MSTEGKIARLRRELAEAEKEAGVPVSGEPVAWQYPYRHIISGEIVWTQTPRLPPAGYTSSHLAPRPLFTHQPHALAAAQAEVKRLRALLTEARDDVSGELDSMRQRYGTGYKQQRIANQAELLARIDAALSTPADTAEIDRLAADAGRYQRLRILGVAPGGSEQLRNGTVLRFQSLDSYVDTDVKAYPSRGEYRAEVK